MLKSSTVLVTMELEGKLYFAADRRISWSMGKAAISPIPKVVKRSNILMSATGVAAICFEILHRLHIPKFNPKKENIDFYVTSKLLPNIIAGLRMVGLVDKKDRRLAGESHIDMSTSILVGLKTKKETAVYEISLDTRHILVDRIDVDNGSGCGGDYAQSVITVLKDNFNNVPIYKSLGMSPEDILSKAVGVAAFHSPGCDNNMDIEVL